MFFFKNCVENETGRLVLNLFLPFLKNFIWGKSKWFAALFQYISISFNWGYNKNKLHQTLDNWSRDKLNFDVLGKGLGTASSPQSVWFIKKNVSHVIFS